MINSGDKNVNVAEIVAKTTGIVKPSNDGIDDYVAKEGFFVPQRDPRELNVVAVLRSDQTKPTDRDPIPMGKLESILGSITEDLSDIKNDNLTEMLLAAFAAGGAVTLEDNTDFQTAVVISNDVNLNLNGKTITVAEDTVGDGVFHVTGGTLTIDGDGRINGTGKNDYNMAIWADGGNVVINEGTFTNEGAVATSDPAHMDLIYTKNGSTVEINGGFFKCVTPKWTLNKHDSSESSIIVKGGTFVDYDPSASETEPGGTVSFVAEGYTVTSEVKDNGEVWYTVVPA